MRNHITAVGVFHIGFSIAGLLAALIVLVATVGAGVISGDELALQILALVGGSVSLLLLVLSLPGIIGGIGLLRGHNWARFVVLILGVLALLNVPIGTLLGSYTLVVLLHPEVAARYEAEGASPATS